MKADDKTISIVLPTYNGEKYIEESIQSILNQTIQNWELVIVDDGSKDSTAEIIERYAKADNRIKVIHNKENMRLPKSLNIGFDNCRGEYYTWTSDDNLYEKDALEKLLLVLETMQDIDIVYALCDIIDSDGKFVKHVEKEKCDIERIYYNNPIGACFLYKKEVHEKLNGYDCSQFLVEDYHFWLRAHKYYRFYLIDEYLYKYRNHENSLTSSKTNEIERRIIALLERERNFCDNKDKLKALRRIIEYKFYCKNWKDIRKYMKEVKLISHEEYKGYPIRCKILGYL